MKRLAVITLALLIILTGCSTKSGTANSQTENNTPQNDGDKVYNIGVIQLVQHDALDDAYRGFVDGLADAGYRDGENINIDLQNAQGEIANTNTIASKLVNDKNDLILAIATPAAQAVANATQDIPVLFTAVTDPLDAGLIEANDKPGGNITGTSDLTPVKEQIELLTQFAPDAKDIGVIYCSNEANSYFQAGLAKEKIEELGLNFKEFTVSESNQIQQVVQTAVGQVDAIYIPTDNMLASAMVQVATIAKENKIPLVGAEEAHVNNGALASFGVSYYELGKITAAQAVEIMNGKDPAVMPVQYQKDYQLAVNEDTLKALGLEMPSDFAFELSDK